MRSSPLLPALLSLLLLVASAWAQVPTYTNSFDEGAGPEWSHPATDRTPAAKDAFLGRFGNGPVTLALTKKYPGVVTLRFDLYVIDSWDGNDGGYGPDHFDVRVLGDQVLLRTTFSNLEENGWNQSYPSEAGAGDNPAGTGAVAKDSLGYSYFGDSVYRLKYDFFREAGPFFVQFAGAGLQDLGDESWGLDNVEVRGAQAASMLTELRFLRPAGETWIPVHSATSGESVRLELRARARLAEDTRTARLEWGRDGSRDVTLTVAPEDPVAYRSPPLPVSDFMGDGDVSRLVAKLGARSTTLRVADLIARIEGTDQMQWSSKAAYQLAFYQGPAKKSRFPVVEWSLEDLGGRAITILPSRRSTKQEVTTPEPRPDFDEQVFELRAKMEVQVSPGNTRTRSARKTITVSNRGERCAALATAVKAKALELEQQEGEHQRLVARRDSMRIPEPIGDAPVMQTSRDFVAAKAQQAKLGEASKKATEVHESIGKAVAELRALRRRLHGGMTEPARAAHASERYKKSAKTPQDKLDFVWGVLGQGAGVPRTPADRGLDDAVLQAEQQVRRLLIPRIGYGLVGIAGLATIPLPSSSPGNFVSFAFFVVGVVVDQEIDGPAFLRDLEAGSAALSAVGDRCREVARLAGRVGELEAQGADADAIHDARVALHHAVIAAHDHTVTAAHELDRLREGAAALERAAKAAARKQDEAVEALAAELKALGQEQEARTWAILEAQNQLEQAGWEVEQSAATVAARKLALQELRERHSQRCGSN